MHHLVISAMTKYAFIVFTAAEVPKIFSRVLGPLANNPTLGVQYALAAGYKKYCF